MTFLKNEKRLLRLLDEYIWCTRGSDPNDTYKFSDEDDIDDFIESLRKLKILSLYEK